MKIIYLLLLANLAFGKTNVFETLKNDGRFEILTELLAANNLKQTLSESGEFTIFAPTDSAFFQVAQDKVANTRAFLLFHTVLGDLRLKKILKKETLPTLSGKALYINRNKVQGVELTETAIKAKNGRIYPIEKILMPMRNQAANLIPTVKFLDLTRYQGTWYEIARYKNNFQKDCRGTRAIYKLTKKSRVSVTNQCQNDKGELQESKGIAVIDDTFTFSKLKVGFVPLLNRLGWLSGDYWVMDLGANYEYAMIGEPNRKFFWILSRSKTISEELYQRLLTKAESFGFKREKIFLSETWK